MKSRKHLNVNRRGAAGETIRRSVTHAPHLGWNLKCLFLLGLLGALPAGQPSPPGARFVVQAAGVEVDLAGVARDHDLRLATTIPALQSAVLLGSPRHLAALRADPRLRTAGLDQPCRAAGDGGGCCDPSVHELTAVELQRERARLDAVFGPLRARASGRGVVVAVLDTGLHARHPALHGATLTGTSLLTGLPWDEDPSGHGTAMAALVASRGQEAPEGVAPAAQILPVRVADKSGRAWTADVAAGIVQAVDRGARVVLLALGTRLPSPVLDQALAYAEARGALVVAAAGNRNVNHDLFPAADPRALSVGAVNDAGELAWSTALAPSTDVLAAGERALTALPRGVGSVSGTSVAAARVAGLAALVLELRPDLSPAALRSLFTGARRPILRHPDLDRLFPAGPIDPAALLRQLEASRATPTLLELRPLPAAARPGDPLRLLARVRNPGAGPTAADVVTVTRQGAALGSIAVPALQPGEERELALDLPAPVAGELEAALGGERRAARLLGAGAPTRDLALSRLDARFSAEGALTIEVEVEGRGGAAQGATLEGQLGGVALGPLEVPALGPGARFVTQLTVDPQAMQDLPGRVVACELGLSTDDEDPRNDAGGLDLLPPGAPEARTALATQYQQNGDLNIIADAPFRVEPARDHLPVLLFVPEKGDLDPNTFVTFSRASLASRTVADRAAAATVVWEDRNPGAVTAAPGTVMLDDLGQPQTVNGTPDLRLFKHQTVDRPGRYGILRVPRAALGVAPVPASDEVRFLTAEVEWSNQRRFLFLFNRTRSGTYKKTLRVSFASAPRPQLPGSEGRYFDAHLHTYAEWYQDDGFDPLAPRRNLGGPIPMVLEAAHALGLTDAIDAARDRVITTDHAAFYEPGDGLRDRPPFGPTALVNSGGRSEHERMGELFGITRGEEVAFHAPQNIFPWLQVPFGAHVLSYRAQHVPGAWHGGSGLARALGDPYPDLPLARVIETLAQQSRGENRHAAMFAAHPYDGIDWQPEHYQAAFQPDPATRSDLPVNAEGDGFVTKGLQLWNGEGDQRRLDPQKIDFMDMNPWADPDFARGVGEWDGELHEGLGHWHGLLSRLFDYELKARPGVRFPRKVFISAGNDAHGDFNYTESREATLINLQSSLKVHGRAFGQCLTYALGAEQDAVTSPERALEALLDGNSLLTDGPLCTVSLDAEDRFDAASLRWQEASPRAADRDGRVGGGGVFDGRGTALVRRGAPGVRLRYRWESTAEFGDVRRIELYRTSQGDPNPLGQRASGLPLLQARGTLAAGAQAAEQEERLDPAEEGLISAPTALQVGAFTGGAPLAPGVEDRRCLTNPVWAVPYDVTVTVDRTETDAQGKGAIPPGALRLVLEADCSLAPRDYGFELKALDKNGDSSDVSLGPIDLLTPTWSARPNGIQDGQVELVNTRPIPLDLDRFGSGPDQVTFVVYTHDPVQDAFGNELHRVAFSFELAGIGTGGGTGPAIPRGTNSTTPGATPGPAPAPVGGGRSGGGCGLAADPAPAGGAAAGLLLALAIALLAARRAAAPALVRAHPRAR